MTGHLAFLQANLAWFVALVVATLAGAEMQRQLGRMAWRKCRRFKSFWSERNYGKPGPMTEAFDPAAQLRFVERANFRRRRVLNQSEARLFDVLERACATETSGWRVLAQVSLGEILTSPDADAYRAINSKRVDLLLVDRDGHAVHAIEYQGTGHHLGPAATRDAVKKEALRKAGIGYVEVLPGDTPTDVRAMVASWRDAGRRLRVIGPPRQSRVVGRVRPCRPAGRGFGRDGD